MGFVIISLSPRPAPRPSFGRDHISKMNCAGPADKSLCAAGSIPSAEGRESLGEPHRSDPENSRVAVDIPGCPRGDSPSDRQTVAVISEGVCATAHSARTVPCRHRFPAPRLHRREVTRPRAARPCLRAVSPRPQPLVARPRPLAPAAGGSPSTPTARPRPAQLRRARPPAESRCA